MPKLMEIVKDTNILVSSTILNYDKPDVVYIPVLPNANFNVKKGSSVLISSPLMTNNEKISRASISGKVENIKKVKTIKGNVDALEINNDFKEDRLEIVINDKIDIILSKYFGINLNNKRGLILNAIDDEVYVLTENAYLFYYDEEFLDLLDKISKIYNLEEIIIAVKSTNSENINKLLEKLGMYPNIKLNILPNLYLLGKNSFLCKHLVVEEREYEIIKASIFYDIYNLGVRKRFKSNMFLTVSGDGIRNPVIMKVKIGTKLEEILNHLEIENNTKIVVNGLLQGRTINPKDFIITEDINSILVIKNKELNEEKECYNCGSCIDICPVGINPLMLENENYRLAVSNKCLKCGLCSYICPAHIDFNRFIRGEEDE